MIDDPSIDQDCVRRHTICVYSLAVAFTMFFVLSMTLIGIVTPSDKRDLYLKYTVTVAYAILPIVYIWILRDLKKTLKEKTDGLIDKDTRYVLYQFYFFILSYLLRLVFFIPQLIGLTVGFDSTFVWQFTDLILNIPWSILPITFILWVHRRNYSQTKKEKERGFDQLSR